MQNAKLSIAVANAIYKQNDEKLAEAHWQTPEEEDAVIQVKIEDFLSCLFVSADGEEINEATKYLHDSLDKRMIFQIIKADLGNLTDDRVNGWKEGE